MRSLLEYLKPLSRGVKANLVPGLVLQAFAALIVVSYYFSPRAREALGVIGAWKEQYGFAYSIPSTIVFGALFPFLILLLTRRIPAGRWRSELLFLLVFWAWRGAEVDAFYLFQGNLFGTSPEPLTITKKVLFDQFVYNPFWVVPVQTAIFLYKEGGYTVEGFREKTDVLAFFPRSVAVLLSTWAVWFPGVILVYSLPSALQLPICNVITCFWCLLLSFMSRDGERH